MKPVDKLDGDLGKSLKQKKPLKLSPPPGSEAEEEQEQEEDKEEDDLVDTDESEGIIAF